nr:RNA-directed DNA polymerase, eukaryota [Tanacetum cinerariifolium]
MEKMVVPMYRIRERHGVEFDPNVVYGFRLDIATTLVDKPELAKRVFGVAVNSDVMRESDDVTPFFPAIRAPLLTLCSKKKEREKNMKKNIKEKVVTKRMKRKSQTGKRKTRTAGEDDISGTQTTAASQRGTRSDYVVVAADKEKGVAVDDGSNKKKCQPMKKIINIAQKTKIKWSVEGDENSRFFHGMLNKKGNQLNIRGVMVDGVWNEKPHDDLERMVTKEEVKRAVWDCGTDKSPGLDGFTFGFYRQFWLTIENDVFGAVNDFRPISLIGGIYKIIAKILANRLVRVLGDIVNEKAYNSVRWDFLDDVLKKFSFGNKWCDWIQTFLKSSRGSIMIIGSPTEEFQFCKGLKQGDPLSPFLFILIMESLHLSFQRVVDAGLFMGIKLSHLVNLSHMFYVDDAVFVGQWSDSNINTLIHVLDYFYRASGLRMNMSKSKIMGVHVEGRRVKHAASKLGCLTLNTPFYYLGSTIRKRLYGRLLLRRFMGKTEAWLSDPSMDYSFRRKTRGGAEQEQLDALMDLVSTVNLVSMSDRWVWTLGSSGEFSVASFRKVIDEKRLPSVCSKTWWVKYVPIKVNVLA